MKRLLLVVALGASLLMPRPAKAFVMPVIDGAALTASWTQYVEILAQWASIIYTAKGHLDAFKDAYKGLSDWKNLGWEDALEVLQMGFMDDVKGIDEIRNVATLSVMTAGQINNIWENLDPDNWKYNSRYKKDAWYKNKVNSLFRQSKKARATRAALMRQMQRHNDQLTKDIARLKELRKKIQEENQKSPVNQAAVAALQAEIQVTEAKHQGEGLQMANQRAIIYLGGQDEAQKSFLEQRDRGWVNSNNKKIRGLADAITR